MKNLVAAILLVLALILSLSLYRTGQQHQESLAQPPMKASELHKEKKETEAEKAVEAVEEEPVPEEPKEAEKPEEAEEERDPDQAAASDEEVPSRAADMAILMDGLSERISAAGGDWSVYVEYLPTGEGIGVDSRSMVAASLIKLYIAGAYLEEVNTGEVQDLYDESLKNMLSQSDNDAANRLITLLGMDRINTFIREHGFEDTQLNRLMLANNGLENYTSVKDCSDLLEEVYQGTFVSREASERILSALKDQSVRTKIPAGLPDDVLCANKTGELPNIENDVAIVYGRGGDYIFCVMSEHVSAGNAYAEIQGMSGLIYEILGTEKEAARTGD